MHGLGNQMFQYALGRRLALERGSQLFLDASWYNPGNAPRTDRPLALAEFNVGGEITFDDRWKHLWLPQNLPGKVRWVVQQRIFPPAWRDFVEEDPDMMKVRGQAFDERVLGAADGAYLCGYWVSSRYFAGIENQLRKDLVLREQPGGRYVDYLERMQDSESVAVHIRRGDYLIDSIFGVLSPSYYRRAIETIRARVNSPRFFVFSDNVREARQVLAGVDCEYVELEPGSSPAQDLSLIASCRHFINANSTFSWWGAWLSQGRDKIVLVPDKWLLGAGLRVEDIYPAGWETVSTSSTEA